MQSNNSKYSQEMREQTAKHIIKDDMENLIFHSDRGCQYSSSSYRKMLESHNIVSSMSKPGCPYDNSPAEGFFATIKRN